MTDGEQRIHNEANGDNYRLQALRAEIERLRAQNDMIFTDAAGLTQVVDALAIQSRKQKAEIERLTAALQALHDWYVEYARINNLFNGDGTPATFHELLEARRALEPRP